MNIGSAMVLAAGLIIAAFAIGGRYEVTAVGDYVVIVDRFTGDGHSCMKFGMCTELDKP